MTRTLAFALFLLSLTASLASAADLTITVSDVHSSTGSVLSNTLRQTESLGRDEGIPSTTF
jgi:hypothetical protein